MVAVRGQPLAPDGSTTLPAAIQEVLQPRRALNELLAGRARDRTACKREMCVPGMVRRLPPHRRSATLSGAQVGRLLAILTSRGMH